MDAKIANNQIQLMEAIKQINPGTRVTEPQPQPQPQPRSTTPQNPRICFPNFNGVEVREWVWKAQLYYKFQPMPESEMVEFAAMHFESKAAKWFQSYILKKPRPIWGEFLIDVLKRFEEKTSEGVVGNFQLLRHVTTVEDYYEKFEEARALLDLEVPNLLESYLMGCFISGLKEEIKLAIRRFVPTTLDKTVELALLEEALIDQRLGKGKTSRGIVQTSHLPFKIPGNSTAPTSKTLNPPNNNAIVKPPLLPTPKTHVNTDAIPVRRLTQSQYQNRRQQGLCYYCDDKYTPGHKCAKPQLFMLCSEDEEIGSEAVIIEPIAATDEVITETENGEISLNAMTGGSGPSTFKVWASVKGIGFTILIDSGATHNFLDPSAALKLHCRIEKTTPMVITVANGEQLVSDQLCPYLTWRMEKQEFTTALRLLPLGGCDVVLRVQWLETLGPVKFDFKAKEMHFDWLGKRIVLKGLSSDKDVKIITAKSLHKYINQNPNAVFGQLRMMRSTDETLERSQRRFQEIIDRFKVVFDEPKGLPPPRLHDHFIPLKEGSKAVSHRPYRFPQVQKNEIERIVQELLDNGVIQHSDSSFSSPVLLVKKKDHTWRMCVDYRDLNSHTVKSKYPIPIIDELLDELYGSKFFSKLDLRSGYHQIRVAPQDVHKTAFITHIGLFEFLVMPFGLSNAPASFQALMNSVFKPFLRKFVLEFFDDILIYSKSEVEHHEHLRLVLVTMKEHQLYAKMSKCRFGHVSIDYLGHIISEDGVSADPTKIEAMLKWPKPKTLRDLRGFLGLTGYYRKFVRGYGVISKTLTDLLKRGQFQWNEKAEVAFNQLKNAMATTPVLAMPNFNEPFEVETDASDKGLGAVLMQKGQPIAYLSKSFGPKSAAMSTYEKEMMAIVAAIQKWRHYLSMSHFVIKTDHQALRYFLNQRVTTHIQQKWLTKLLGLDYEIQYKKGAENRAADSLSQMIDNEGELLAISLSVPVWVEELTSSLEGDKDAIQLINGALSELIGPKASYFHNGVLMFKGKIYVGEKEPWRQKIICEFHQTGHGGHSGRDNTIHKVERNFYWPKMREQIKKYVEECDVCQRNKTEGIRYPGLLQPLQIPSQVWTGVSLDFVEGLPKSNGKTTIMVVVDRLSKYAHFVALSHPFTAKDVANSFFDHVVKLHGLPRSLVSDRDKVFVSAFWTELFKLMGVQLAMSSAYHPQSDGQTERVNRCLENYLRCFVGEKPKTWSQCLSLAEWWYNTSKHSAIKMTPFEALYGYAPSSLPTPFHLQSKIGAVGDFLKNQQSALQILKDNLGIAQNRMKQYQDQHRSERVFSEVDWVYLRLQPYRQVSVQARQKSQNQKLSPKYYGPFEVIHKVGAVAYKLKLPSSSSIHPVFHVSLLKKKLGKQATPITELPAIGEGGEFLIEPVAILDRRMVKKNNRAAVQVLVKWSNTPSVDSTWEDWDNFKSKFPNFPPCGQEGFEGGESVTGGLTTSKPKIKFKIRSPAQMEKP